MAAGSILQAVQQSRAENPGMPVEVEVENESQIREALEAGVERLLLDNFPLPELKQAVQQVGARAQLEASGGITLTNIRETALTGVDFISTGTLTKNVQAVDLSLLFEEPAGE